MTDIIVCSEKYGEICWDATTPEKFAKSSLAILTERFLSGDWYMDPEDDGLGDSEWADNERRQNEAALALTAEQLELLPEDARKAVLKRISKAKKDSAEDRAHRAWYEAAQRVVEEQSLEVVAKGRSEIPLAYQLLLQRAGYEYEGIDLVYLNGSED